jgi:catalase
MHYQRDGAMALGNNGGSGPNYEPNSREDAPKQNSAYADPAWDLGNVKVDRATIAVTEMTITPKQETSIA